MNEETKKGRKSKEKERGGEGANKKEKRGRNKYLSKRKGQSKEGRGGNDHSPFAIRHFLTRD